MILIYFFQWGWDFVENESERNLKKIAWIKFITGGDVKTNLIHAKLLQMAKESVNGQRNCLRHYIFMYVSIHCFN